jgi:alpha-ketoglutarate-dependent taurine dioxygenase
VRAHAWEKDDVLSIDNRRVLHGRNAFTDAERRILAMFGYVSAAFTPGT